MGSAAGHCRGKSVKAPVRVVSPFVPILRAGWHPYTSEGLKRGVGRLVARCWQAIKEGRNYNAQNGQIYHAVISKGTLEASAQGNPEGRF